MKHFAKTLLLASAMTFMATSAFAHCGMCGEKDNHAKYKHNDYKADYKHEKHAHDPYVKNVTVYANEDMVRDLQTRLRDEGYNVAVDGVWGNRTDNALRMYQKKNNLRVTGEIDPRTRQSLMLDW